MGSWEVLHTSIKKKAEGGQIATFILNECGFFSVFSLRCWSRLTEFPGSPLWEWTSTFFSSMSEGFNSENDNVCQSLSQALASVSCMFSSQSCLGEETKTIPSWDEPGE